MNDAAATSRRADEASEQRREVGQMGGIRRTIWLAEAWVLRALATWAAGCAKALRDRADALESRARAPP